MPDAQGPTDDEVAQAMSILARRKHAQLTPEERSAAASEAAKAKHAKLTAAERSRRAKELAQARWGKKKKRAVKKSRRKSN